MTFFEDEFEAKVCIADMLDKVTYEQAEALAIALEKWDKCDQIKNLTIPEMAEFLKSLLDGENNHNVGCYGCINYGTHHSDIKKQRYKPL